MTEKNYFQQLNAIDVTANLEEKQGFSYLSWAFAQEILGEKHPEAEIVVRDYGPDELPYLKTELGYFVQVYITIGGIKKGKPFPVMDGANRPLGAEYWKKDKSKPNGGEYVMNRQPTSFDINNSIQRAFVKAAAEHGLGLYVYRGEDLPTAVVNDRKETILADFKAWRENPKTENWFVAKESLLGPTKDWDAATLEGIHKELTMMKAKALEKAKAAEELARREGSKPETEEKKPLKDQGMDLEKQKFILDACKQYPLVDETVGEFMTKLKKETLTQLTGKQFENLYGIVGIKIKTAEKELAANASS
jgi:hypothetical protein